jgi:hypothetical protein
LESSHKMGAYVFSHLQPPVRGRPLTIAKKLTSIKDVALLGVP